MTKVILILFRMVAAFYWSDQIYSAGNALCSIMTLMMTTEHELNLPHIPETFLAQNRGKITQSWKK